MGGERGIRLDPGPALISAAVNCKTFSLEFRPLFYKADFTFL